MNHPNPPVTDKEIESWPPRARQYIYLLTTDCDPAGTIRNLEFAKDSNRQLLALVAEQEATINRLQFPLPPS